MHLCDRGHEESTASELLPRIDHKVISIKDGGLVKVPLHKPEKGSVYSEGFTPDRWSNRQFTPPYIQPPQASSLNIFQLDSPKKCRELQDALESALQIESKHRGWHSAGREGGSVPSLARKKSGQRQHWAPKQTDFPPVCRMIHTTLIY